MLFQLAYEIFKLGTYEIFNTMMMFYIACDIMKFSSNIYVCSHITHKFYELSTPFTHAKQHTTGGFRQKTKALRHANIMSSYVRILCFRADLKEAAMNTLYGDVNGLDCSSNRCQIHFVVLKLSCSIMNTKAFKPSQFSLNFTI